MRFLISWIVFLLGTVLTSGPGGSEDDEPTADKVAANAQRMLDRYQNNAVAAIAFLMGENAQVRAGRKTAQDEVTRLTGLVSEGKLLTKEQAAQWDAYLALGTPEDLKRDRTERDNLKAETSKTLREKLLREVAEAEQWKLPLLTRLARREDGSEIEFVVREVEQDGVKTPRAFVKDGDRETPAADFAGSTWPDLVDALASSGSTGSTGNSQAKGQQFTGQGRGERKVDTSQSNPALQFIKSRYQSPGQGAGAARGQAEK